MAQDMPILYVLLQDKVKDSEERVQARTGGLAGWRWYTDSRAAAPTHTCILIFTTPANENRVCEKRCFLLPSIHMVSQVD